MLDVIKLLKYRADFYGELISKVTHEAARTANWPVGEREMMDAFVAKSNQCAFCTKAHASMSASCASMRARTSPILKRRTV